MINTYRIQKLLITALFFLLPFHTLVIYRVLGKVIGIPGINYWKELCIITLLGIYLAKFKGAFDFIDFFLVSFIAYISIFVVMDPGELTLMGFRTYSQPLFIILICKRIKLSDKLYYFLIKGLIRIAIILSIWGIYQALVLKGTFLIGLGYKPSEKHPSLLHHSFYIAGGIIQRNASTFSYPNACGLFMASMIVVLHNYRSLFTKKVFLIFTFILHISLLLTFARASILGLLVVYTLFNKKVYLYMLGMGVILYFITQLVLPDVYYSLTKWVAYNISGKDPSAGGHLHSFYESIALAKENWLYGLGFGTVGGNAAEITGVFIDVESSFFAILLDTGFIGLIFYLMVMFLLIKTKVILNLMIILSSSYFFLPTILDVGIVAIVFLLIAIMYARLPVKPKPLQIYEKNN